MRKNGRDGGDGGRKGEDTRIKQFLSGMTKLNNGWHSSAKTRKMTRYPPMTEAAHKTNQIIEHDPASPRDG